MAFIFSTSHLPETRFRRPDDLEEEDEELTPQPMPRAGGVRAFSHLPPARALADTSGPLSTRPATPVGRPRPHAEPEDDQDTAQAPVAESDHDDDTRAHAEYADDTPWHSPRITTQDQPPESHQEDDHAQEEGDHPAPSMHRDPSHTRSSGFIPSPQDLRDTFHSTVGEDFSQDNRPALPSERQLPPRLRDQRTGLPRGFAGKAEYHDLVYRPGSSPGNERDQRDGFFQNVADTRAPRPAPSGSVAPQVFAQNSRPAAQPAQKGGQNIAAAPPPAPAQGSPPTFKVDPADESKGFMLKDPVTQRLYPSDRTFGDHVRSILQEELEKSPTARNLLERIIGKSGMPVIIQSTPKPEAYPEIKNGIFIIYINPTNVRLGTLTHEITHHLQKLALDKALASEEIKAIKDPNKRPAAVADKIRELLNGVLPVSPPGERTGKLGESQDYMENEAIRATNVAQAEISASRVKEKLDAMNKSERDSYLNDHTKLAALFWTEQGLHEAPGHDANDKTSFPIDTRYGDPAHFKHVLETLGITEQELMEACPYKEKWDKAAQERAKKSQPSGRAGVR